MFDREQEEIFQDLKALPPEKVSEVRDYVAFLKERYGKQPVENDSEVWTEEDAEDFSKACWSDAEESVPWMEPPAETFRALDL